MRIALAFRLFFKALFDARFVAQVTQLLEGSTEPTPQTKPVTKKPARKPPTRSDAITLLATLQREARLVDMIKEPLSDFSDEQVGAAARDVLRDCGQVIDRLFGVAPLVDQEEGSEVEVPAGYDAGRVRLIGNVSGEPPVRGRLVHHGWIATRCEVPSWTGGEPARLVVAPQEVELS